MDRISTCVTSLAETGKVLDLFSGSGVVAHWLRHCGYVVHANDMAPYSEVVNRVNLELTKSFVRQTYPDLKAMIDHCNSLVSPRSEFYFSKYYSEGSDRLFYTKENGLFIDAVLEYISTIDPDLRDIILSDLLVKMSRNANTSGVFKAFYKSFGGSNSDSLERIKSKIKIEAPSFSDHPVGKSFRINAADFFDQVDEQYHVVYMDPPYNQHQYSANYHLLEYACLPYDERYIPKDDQVSGIDPDLYKSPYCSKRTCYEELEKLMSAACVRAKYAVLSYNENGHIPKGMMANLLSQFGSVTSENISYVNYRGGRHRKNSENMVSEFLFTVAF